MIDRASETNLQTPRQLYGYQRAPRVSTRLTVGTVVAVGCFSKAMAPLSVFLLVLAASLVVLAGATSVGNDIVIPPSAGKVLVLGAGGFLGRYLSHALHQAGYDTVTVDNRTHVDLRIPGSLAAHIVSQPLAWSATGALNVSYCFFLACEVGGSRFIASSSHAVQSSIAHNNAMIYSNVFPWLREHSIPFLFTSSVLQSHPSPYGAIKRLGESWAAALGPWQLAPLPSSSATTHADPAASAIPATAGPVQRPLGVSVRLWNLFGRERGGTKGHVLSDWLHHCLLQGTITPLTNSHETRRFLHASDAAAALLTVMRSHGVLGGSVVDVADPASAPVQLRRLAPLVSAAAGHVLAEAAQALGAAGKAKEIRERVKKGTFCPVVFPQVEAAMQSSEGSVSAPSGSPSAPRDSTPPPTGSAPLVPVAAVDPGWAPRVSLPHGLLDAAHGAVATLLRAGMGTGLIGVNAFPRDRAGEVLAREVQLWAAGVGEDENEMRAEIRAAAAEAKKAVSGVSATVGKDEL